MAGRPNRRVKYGDGAFGPKVINVASTVSFPTRDNAAWELAQQRVKVHEANAHARDARQRLRAERIKLARLNQCWQASRMVWHHGDFGKTQPGEVVTVEVTHGPAEAHQDIDWIMRGLANVRSRNP